MAVAAALNYNFRPQIYQFVGRRKNPKAENRLISSHFRPLSGKAHCIKDCGKLGGACGGDTFIVETKKADIETAKPDIEGIKVDIENTFHSKTARNICKLVKSGRLLVCHTLLDHNTYD